MYHAYVSVRLILRGFLLQTPGVKSLYVAPPPPKKLTLGHLDTNDQKLPKHYLYLGFLFSRNHLFLEKKNSTSTQEEQGSKKGGKFQIPL